MIEFLKPVYINEKQINLLGLPTNIQSIKTHCGCQYSSHQSQDWEDIEITANNLFMMIEKGNSIEISFWAECPYCKNKLLIKHLK